MSTTESASPPARRRTWTTGLVWVAALVALAAIAGRQLEVTGDLRAFMPSPRNDAQRVLLDAIGEGSGSRLLLVALAGGDTRALGETSSRLRARLERQPGFRVVHNRPSGLDDIPAELRAYRYLLSPNLAQRTLDSEYLRAALTERLGDLASPAAEMVEPLIASDPTLETLAIAEHLEPARTPRALEGVWFDRAGSKALLLVELDASGVDPARQRIALVALRAAFEGARASRSITLEISGPAAFAASLEASTRREATRLGLFSSLIMLALLAVAYRDWRAPLIAALPLASAGIGGLFAVGMLFGSVHGITLAFGFTLIGVVQDYPVHLLSHRDARRDAAAVARGIWPTLVTGVIATCLAYASFFAAGVEGLKQLATFTITGLVIAALATRWLLPRLLHAPPRDVQSMRGLAATHTALRRVTRMRPMLAVLAAAAAIATVFVPGRWWDNDLAALTPLRAELLLRDRELRHELGAPDVRYLLVIDARDIEGVLQASERLEPKLDALVQKGALDGFELPSGILPSARTQSLRQARLPDAKTLRRALSSARQDLPFREDAFLPFLADVERARTAAPLDLESLGRSTPGASASMQIRRSAEGASAWVALSGVADANGIARSLRSGSPGVSLLDLKGASESLAAAYRDRVVAALAVALVLLAAAVAISLRRLRRIVAVMSPVLLALAMTVATLHLFGVAFNLFHLIALILGAGLGLDYALFFEHGSSGSQSIQRRTLHAVLVCALSTFAVFGLLATSDIPVLRAIGATVTLAVVFNFLFAAAFAQDGDPPVELPHAHA